jgi:hypothetical protein
VRSLPKDVTWRWYSSDPGSLRLIDDEYRVGYEDNFAYVERPTLVQPRTFLTDVMAEDLPNVAWIDPNFVDLGGPQGADDDHPPTDVMAGQSFVLKIYRALSTSADARERVCRPIGSPLIADGRMPRASRHHERRGTSSRPATRDGPRLYR